jgi:glucose/arabinose dehydrogenase
MGLDPMLFRPRAHWITSALLLVILAACLPLAGQKLPAGFVHETLATGFDQPVGLTILPDSRVIVIEKVTGHVKVFAGGKVGTLGTIPGVYSNYNERGLLGVEVDPGWPARPYLYFHHTVKVPPATWLSMFRIKGDLIHPGSTNLTLDQPYLIVADIPDVNEIHNGGTLRFGPDGMLYVSLGDDAFDCQAQETWAPQGKILRIDVSKLPGKGLGPPPITEIAPKDNPFPKQTLHGPLVWCYGLRNPFRFNIDPASGKLYIADVGSTRVEELNEASGGENFGWPWYEGPYGWRSCPSNRPPNTLPIAYYDRSQMNQASIVSFTCYRNRLGGGGNFGNDYEGDVFYVDFFEGFVRRLKKAGGAWKPAPPVPGQPSAANWGEELRFVSDARVGPDGAIYYTGHFTTSLNRIRFQPKLPSIVTASEAPVGQPLTVSARRDHGDFMLLALGTVRISPLPLPGVFGRVETIAFPLAAGMADSAGHFDVRLGVPEAVAGFTFYFQCVALAGNSSFISPVSVVKAVRK